MTDYKNLKLIATSSPHIRAAENTRSIMLDVIVAMLPALAWAVWMFGFKALTLTAVSVAACMFWEWLYRNLMHKPQSVGDLSAVVTGMLLAFVSPVTTPYWMIIIGAFFAIVVVKCLFGGLGHNFANPAITGRVFMLLCFSSVAGGAMPRMLELQTSATPLELLPAGTVDLPSLLDMFLGLRGGAVGEGCIIALLIGYVYLVARGVIKWYVPAAFVGVVFVCFAVATGDLVLALYEIMAGGVFIGAIFMATDYVTTPITNLGKIVFAVGCGLITFIIRYFCAYPEGVSFSILAMNILTPMIERFTARKPLGGG